MLNSRLIRKQDADLHLQVMSYLIRKFGAPARPPVPSPLHKARELEKLAWTDLDTRSVFDWADDNFETLKTLCHMDKFKTHLVPAGDGVIDGHCAATKRLDSLAAGRIPYNQPGVSQILYDPRDGSDPGHFVATTLLQLAELRVSGFAPEIPLSELMQRMVTLTAAVYNRQGFVLANLPYQISAYLTSEHDLRAVPHRVAINNLCFATCLALRIRHQSKEQIIATYGVRLTKSFRKKIHHACRQVDSYTEELAILQLLAAPKARHQPRSNQSRKSA